MLAVGLNSAVYLWNASTGGVTQLCEMSEGTGVTSVMWDPSVCARTHARACLLAAATARARMLIVKRHLLGAAGRAASCWVIELTRAHLGRSRVPLSPHVRVRR